jgi:hypothetical protein
MSGITLIINNFKAAVKNADWYDLNRHPKIQREIGYLKSNALKVKPGTTSLPLPSMTSHF